MRNKVLDAFHNQLIQARKRGLGFEFTYLEWCAWWQARLGSNWFELRGRGKQQFCMARKGDKGPYVVTNVKCITNAENSKEQKRVGPRHISVDMIKVSAIKQSKLTQRKLAKFYGVSQATISRYKNRSAS